MKEQELLNLAASKHVLFAGEQIIDRYIYVAPLGRASKEAIPSVLHQHKEDFLGGVDAAAKHASALAAHIDIRSGGTLYRKTRYVEPQHNRKLFQCYSIERAALLPDLGGLSLYDAVVCLDYGHDMFTHSVIEGILGQARYLAVNVQTNSGNYGYNLATKWPKTDFLCVDEAEARLATQNRSGSIQQSLMQLATRAEKVVITLGKDGAVGYSPASDIVFCPAFTDKVVDTIGAGDAFFACTALVAADADLLSLLRIGNAAGALKSGIVGHRKGITKDDLCNLLAAVPRLSVESARKLPC
jgi:bifunctional ADP-heptose synthase (sugar kinase/adenylyltransferase)